MKNLNGYTHTHIYVHNGKNKHSFLFSGILVHSLLNAMWALHQITGRNSSLFYPLGVLVIIDSLLFSDISSNNIFRNGQVGQMNWHSSSSI